MKTMDFTKDMVSRNVQQKVFIPSEQELPNIESGLKYCILKYQIS